MNFNEQEFLNQIKNDCAADDYELLKAVPVAINDGMAKAYVLAIDDGDGNVHGEVIIPAAIHDANAGINVWTTWMEEYSEIDSDILPVAAPPEILDLLTPPKSEQDRQFIAERWRKWSRLVYDGFYSGAGQAE